MEQKLVFEIKESAQSIGWKVYRPKEKHSIVSETHLRRIIEFRNNKKIYEVKLPELSREETELINNAIEMHRKNSVNSSAVESFEFYCESNFIELENEQKKYLLKILEHATCANGVLDSLLQDPELEEIAAIGIGKEKPVYVFDSKFGWLATNIYFTSEEEVKRIINSMAGTLGRRITLQKPKLNAVLANGSRLNACIEPATVSGPSITIRKFREDAFTPIDLVNFGSISFEQLAFLWIAIQSDCSILVCGNTGSGKTTLLNALLNFVPEHERIISVEETPELSIMHPQQVKLSVAEDLGITMQELIVNTLRMRPDRVIIGEMRNREEVGAFMDTLLAGQGKGCFATFHAQSGKEALARLSNLGAENDDLNALDLIVTQKRWSSYSNGFAKENRKVIEICEPETKHEKLGAEQVFGFDFEKNIFRKNSNGKKVCEKIMRAFSLDKNGIEQELGNRMRFLKALGKPKQGEFFDAINNYGKAN
ncbi:MAG TPA: ATPase, T2SS/T4P/T4SS family [archaeon]|nr:ATPase, T2SS/T4P/T4SS family [archaeon]